MRITVGTVLNKLGVSEIYDIANAIRNEDPNMQQYLPLANAENVAEFGQALLQSQTLQNNFIISLVDRIGLVVVRAIHLENQLKKFKKGAMPLGRTIEEIFTDITKAQKYDPEDAENTVFKRTIPNVHTLFHEKNREDVYPQTIQDASLRTAFVSWDTFGTFITSIITSIYNSAEVDEYAYMKLLVDNYYAKGQFKVVKVVKPDTETATREFVKKVRATAKKMALPSGSRDFNSLAVHTRSDMEDLHLLIDADLEAELDVDVLARAFNMDKTEFLGHVTIIDGFATKGLEAVLIDESFFMVYDNLLQLETIRNPKGLYWNYYYHVQQTLSVSRFANAVAFVSGDVPPVTQVIVNPTILALKPNRSFAYKAYVRQTDDKTYPITWTVEGSQGANVASGTSISSDGVLTLGANQTGELVVKATVTYDKTSEGEDGSPVTEQIDVFGTSIVTVIPTV